MNPAFTFADRKRFYEKAFPDKPESLIAAPYRLDGVWQIGNDYRNRSDYYGAFPASFLRRVDAVFPDAERTLMLFSGSVARACEHVTFDINPKLKPDVVGNAEEVHRHFPRGHFDFVVADPPYSAVHALRYGTRMPNRLKVMRSVAQILQPGGFLVWLDTKWPMHRKTELRFCGVISVIRSTNHDIRGTFLFQRV